MIIFIIPKQKIIGLEDSKYFKQRKNMYFWENVLYTISSFLFKFLVIKSEEW